MRIVGFSQLHNELEKGNLENWFRSMQTVCDKIYIYDQASNDGSHEYYKRFDNVEVIYSPTNNYINERICKQKLLDLIKSKENPGTWIFWMDGDTFLEKCTRKELEGELIQYERNGCDSVKLRHYNLWRSDVYYRIDSSYHSLHSRGVNCFWKLVPYIQFETTTGLHRGNCPKGFKKTGQSELALIHRGFSTDEQIVKRYHISVANGVQEGSYGRLSRLINEKRLSVQELPQDRFPEWAPKDRNRVLKGPINI